MARSNLPDGPDRCPRCRCSGIKQGADLAGGTIYVCPRKCHVWTVQDGSETRDVYPRFGKQ